MHDQIAALISPEHFTIGHVSLSPGAYMTTAMSFGLVTSSFSITALKFGVLHTWFPGLVLGVCLAMAATVGGRPELRASDLRRPVGMLLLSMAAGAALAGVLGGLLAAGGVVSLPSRPFEAVPADRHTLFLGVFWMHAASTAIGVLGGVLLVVRTWRKRRIIVGAADTHGSRQAEMEAR